MTVHAIEPDFTPSESALMQRLTQLLAARRTRRIPGNGAPQPTKEATAMPQPGSIIMNPPDAVRLDVHTPPEGIAVSAATILVSAADAVDDRAALRDQPNGERSMRRAVASFNAMYGTQLTELQGWQFMVLLKMARSAGGRHHLDDFTGQASYSGLAGECAAHQHQSPHCVGHSKPHSPT